MKPIRYQVARAGKILGAYDSTELVEKIGSGMVLPSDSFWSEGMSEWKPVSDFQPANVVTSRPPVIPSSAACWNCDSCRAVFQAPAVTADGERQIGHACWFLAGAVVVWIMMFGALSIPAESYERMKVEPVAAIIGASALLPLLGWLLWKTVTILGAGLVAKGIHIYQGRKSSCPACGSSAIRKA